MDDGYSQVAVGDRRVGPVAVDALGVVGEDEAGRVDAVLDGEIVVVTRHAVIVVAGAACCAVRHFAPVARLRRVLVVFLVAGLAVADVLAPPDVRKIVLAIVETEDHVAVAADVDVVNQRLHIDGIARVAVDRTRVVAGDAVVDVGARAAVEFEAVVAGVTGVVVDDAALECRLAARRHEVEDAVG